MLRIVSGRSVFPPADDPSSWCAVSSRFNPCIEYQLMYSFYQPCKLHGVNFEEYMKKALAVMTMNMDKIIFEKNKNGTITGFKSHTISNEVLDELMPWNENFEK